MDCRLEITPRAARVNKKMSVGDAAKGLGVSVYTLKNWESGKSFPTIVQARAMSVLYGVPLDNIIFLPKDYA